MKKLIIIVLIVLIFITGILLLVRNKTGQSTTIPVVTSGVPTLIPSPFITPSGNKMNINGVSVNNFYKTPVAENKQYDILITNGKNYQVVYLPKYNKFILTILSSNFEQTKKIAESDFLKVLEIDEKDACKLSVEVSTINSVNPELAGKIFPLSFCSATP